MPASLINDMERSSGMDGVYNLACNLSNYFMTETINNLDCLSVIDGEHRGKKSQNTTECVPVPSSEHVAEIVGRQGCKIKALRAKTNTYIKTPVRGEEPVFVVTGRKEDVCAAKKEIVSAAEHFSQIRAQRKNNLNGTLIPGPNSNIPGQKTIQVRVPYRVVGLVVGPKGATIKRIQQTTNTYIVTPSRDKEPVFDVTGLPDNVESARKEIEAHIAMRTGGSVDDQLDDYNSNGLDSLNNLNANLNSSYFKNDFGSSMICQFSRDSNLMDLANLDNMVSYSVSSRNSKNNMISSLFNGYSAFSQGYDAEDALSPTFDSHGAASTWPDFRTSSSSPEGDSNSLFNAASISSTLSDLSSQRSNSLTGPLVEMISGSEPHPMARRTHSDPLNMMNLSLGPFQTASNTFSAAVSKCTISASRSLSPDALAPGSRVKRDCYKCQESEVVAALVPCGHNNFCMECAEAYCQEGLNCPLCDMPVSTAVRILH